MNFVSLKTMPLPNPKNPAIKEELVRNQCQANQSLVIASLRAQDLQAQAEASVQRQTEFLSMLAHELRTPLTPIALASDMLEKLSGAHPQLPHLQQIIARQVGHMARLLEDLLDASRVSSGKISLKKTLLLLTDIVKNALEISQPFLDEQVQTLTLDVPKSPIVIEGDAMRLAQVFANLLINASKYSPAHTHIRLSARQGGDGTVAVSVKDQGMGIEPAFQPFIFDLFMQAPRALDRSQGGLGIGLSMVRTLVEMHGGTVAVSSQGLDCGSEFTVVLPISCQAAPALASSVLPERQARPCRILLIEDSVDSNEALSLCLTQKGHSVASALDGPSGVALAKEGGYDLIICDIGLPDMDGFEVMRAIRQFQQQPAPYGIAMTGYDQQSFRNRALKVGFDHYLVKPIFMEPLQHVMAKVFPQQP